MSPNPPRYRKHGRYLIYVGTLDPGVCPADPGDIPDDLTDIHPDRTVHQGLPLATAVSLVRTLNRSTPTEGHDRPWRFLAYLPKRRATP